MKAAPCKDCPDRHAGCHAVCDRYKQWQIEHAAEKDARYRQAQPEAIATRYAIDITHRKRKRARKER